jgi:hypothetical protein
MLNRVLFVFATVATARHLHPRICESHLAHDDPNEPTNHLLDLKIIRPYNAVAVIEVVLRLVEQLQHKDMGQHVVELAIVVAAVDAVAIQ